jgi:hypothetical protein
MAMRAVDLRHVRMAAMVLSLRLETRIITAKNTAIWLGRLAANDGQIDVETLRARSIC